MSPKLVNTGIDVMGAVPWGTHFCQFYQTKTDLLDTLVPYFKAGLENNEFCMWITAEPLSAKEASQAMRRAMPDFADRLNKGQIEILPHTKWYLEGGKFDQQRVLAGWVDKLNAALAAGYVGLRLTGNTFWLEKQDWKSFTAYEAAVADVIGKYHMLALCTYSLDKCGAAEVMDVIRNHEFALIRKEGEWDLIENAIHRRTREAMGQSEEKYRQLMESLQEGVWVIDEDASTTFVNPRMAEMLGYSVDEMLGKKFLSFIDESNLGVARERMERRRQGMKEELEFNFRRKDGSRFSALISTAPLTDASGDFSGVIAGIVDITEHKRMEQEIQDLMASVMEEKDRMSSLVNSIPDEVWFADQQKKFTLANPAAVREFGLATGDAVDVEAFASSLEVYRPDGTPRPVEEAPPLRALGGEVVRDQEEIIKIPSRGELRYRRVSAAPVKDANGNVLGSVSIARDVTGLVKAERRSYLLAQAAAELLESDSPQQAIDSLCSKAMTHLDCHVFFIFTVDESAGRLHLRAYGGVSEEQAHEIEWLDFGVTVCGCAARDGCRIVAEDILQTPDPRTELVKSYGIQAYACHPIEAQSGLLGTLSFGTRTRTHFTDEELSLMKAVADLAAIAMQRKHTEETLRETRDYLDNLLNCANAPIIVWDPELRITRFNRAFQRMTGLKEDEVMGRQLDQLFPEKTRGESLKQIRRALAGERWEATEIPVLRVDGVVRTVLWNSATVYAADGKRAMATIAQGQDITERKLAEEDVRNLNDDLKARTEALEMVNSELQSFSYSVSHDLRAPLRSIDGFSLALLEDYADKLDDSGKGYLHRVRSASQLMGRLIDDLLELSRVSRADMHWKKVDLSELAREIRGGLEAAAPNSHAEFIIAPHISGYGDTSLLRAALANLLDNAWKFTGKRDGPKIEFGARNEDGRQVYFVRDNGVGFDMTYVDKLFDPFQRLHSKDEFPGTGIGLATVKRIITRHRGRVWAEGEVGHGATFYFTLSDHAEGK